MRQDDEAAITAADAADKKVGNLCSGLHVLSLICTLRLSRALSVQST